MASHAEKQKPAIKEEEINDLKIETNIDIQYNQMEQS